TLKIVTRIFDYFIASTPVIFLTGEHVIPLRVVKLDPITFGQHHAVLKFPESIGAVTKDILTTHVDSVLRRKETNQNIHRVFILSDYVDDLTVWMFLTVHP